MEDELSRYPGVIETQVGYAGGQLSHPTYEQVCSKETGHAEAVRVTFDSEKTSYEKLIIRFLENHERTASYRSDPKGQYRIAIFYCSSAQKALIDSAVEKFSKLHSQATHTFVQPAKEFWDAEEYHQKYYKKHKLGACAI